MKSTLLLLLVATGMGTGGLAFDHGGVVLLFAGFGFLAVSLWLAIALLTGEDDG